MADPNVPHVPAWFQSGFHGFLRPFLKRHFHAIAIERRSRCESSMGDTAPLIVYGNHPSWWDPLIAHFLNRTLFPGRQFHAPIDAEALEQYRVFGKLGFYGVRLNTTSGAAAFLKQSMAILGSGGTAIWITPEGRFSDARDHSAELMPGLAHLCTRMSMGWALPLALEYVFWDERLPVCLAKIRLAPGRLGPSRLVEGTVGRIADRSVAASSDWPVTTRDPAVLRSFRQPAHGTNRGGIVL